MKKLRFVLGLLLLAALLVLTVQAQEYTSRDEVAKDAELLRDFQIQGEYSGKAETPFGVNIIANGKGEFRIVAFQDGLPGDGWTRGKMRVFGKAKLNDDGKLEVAMEEIDNGEGRKKLEKEAADQLKFTVEIKAGKASIKLNDTEVRFEKIERNSPTESERVPRGAIVLFADGKKNEAMWEKGKVNEEAKTLWAEAETKAFEKKPYTLHIEFLLSYMPQARGQGRANSGVYIDQAYECQVLDSFGLEGENNECGGFYQMSKPAVNMCFPPLQWQTYDIDFVPAKFDADGKKTAKAKITVVHNGVKIHDGIEPEKETPGCRREEPSARGLYLQGHGNKVQYRNIWIKYNDE